MSGHSKWSTIKHKKAALDAKRGKAWSKLARAITMAARNGGKPEDNPRLRLAIDKARGANMPKDTIEKAIKKGTGELEGESYEEVIYEGYGPEGVAVMCKVLTDNRHRTAPEIKKIFERSGGNLGTPNCVAWMFQAKGVITVAAEAADEDRIMELALEAGAEDVESSEMVHQITTTVDAFEAVRDAIRAAGIEVQTADVEMVASNQISLGLAAAQKVMRLIDALDNHDDVESVSSNFDVPDSVMRELARGE
ncbi:MAG: YebC/PmpR family DNA-binding transcriptional regulator [Phycisphaerales bacterium]|nr:MAG: YebC/PmpR family DNA-binding transcriptional regulator [Phycisphaerales bacterium]